MDIEERMSKAEAEMAALKECQQSLLQGQAELRSAMERGFIEQRTATTDLRASMEAGFAEQRRAMAELRATMDAGSAEHRRTREVGSAEHRRAMEAGFAEQRAAFERSTSEERVARAESIRELREEMQRGFRWTFSALLSILALVLGIIARLAGAF